VSRAPVRSSAMTAILIVCMLVLVLFMVSTGGKSGEKFFLTGFSWVWLVVTVLLSLVYCFVFVWLVSGLMRV